MGLDVDALLNGREGPALLSGSALKTLNGGKRRAAILVQQGGEAQYIAAGIEVGHPQGMAGALADLAEGLHGVERVAAKEEIVAVHTQVRTAQHMAEDGEKKLLGLRFGLHMGGNRQVGVGQQGFIHLAVGGQGDGLQPKNGGGDHIMGEVRGAQSQKLFLRNGSF